MNISPSNLSQNAARTDRWARSSSIMDGKDLRKLPRLIAITVIGTVLFAFVVFAASVIWMTGELDRQALQNSFVQMRTARSNLLSKARLVTLDYTNWDAAVSAMRTADELWLYDNVGSAALIGQAIQLTDMWGGAMPSPVGWITGDQREPRVDALTPELRHLVEEHLSASGTSVLNGVEFFGWSNEDVFAFAAASFAPVYGAAPAQPGQINDGHLVMGVRLTEKVMGKIGNSYFLNGVQIVAQEPITDPFIPLPGIDGKPVAFVTWDEPHPSLDMLKQMTPILALALVISVILMAFGVRLAQRSARQLIQSERLASKAAQTDFLTGLPNRAAFNLAIAGTAAVGGRAVMFLDLNGFKSINDSAGHAVGDKIIVSLANRLASLVDSKRFLAHISGDEFVFLITSPDAEHQMIKLIWDVRDIFTTPFVAMGRQFHLQAAIGYAVQSTEEISGSELMRQADLAMYAAKASKQARPIAFSVEIEHRSQNKFAIEQALRDTLENPEDLSVVYQPIVRVDGQFERAEALARWAPAHLGPVSPEEFIPVAEQSGFIVDLGRLLFRQVCKDLAAHPTLLVNVNISTIQLLDPDFQDNLRFDLAEYEVTADRIQLELTESILVSDTDRVRDILSDISDMGFMIALDDFGTGYSSISYLDRLKFDTLKLDRSFLSQIHSSEKRRALIESVIQMAHRLNLAVVCEGVETTKDLYLLQEIHCDYVQGYLMEKPIPIKLLSNKWLLSNKYNAA